MQTDRIKVLLVDDQVLFVESLQMVLESRTQDIEVVGVAYDGADVLEIVRDKRPDVVLMDIRMPNVDGVDATRMIRQEFPATHIMILTTFDKDEYVHKALQLGAVGYLLKDIHPSYLIDAIHSVYRGGVLISPRVARRLVARDAGTCEGEAKGPGFNVRESMLSELSMREAEVLHYIAKGHNNREIADKLFIAEQTVKNHVSVIYAKLGIRGRMEALLLARELGLDQETEV
jgi:DNA-binding NarL/FixJ family response regulator